MIYVLQSAGYDKNGQYIDLIKIGYSKDWKKRKDVYAAHNPTVKILYLSEDGDEDDEASLHLYFRKFRFLEYGREWYIYSDEIVDFFAKFPDFNELRESQILPAVLAKDVTSIEAYRDGDRLEELELIKSEFEGYIKSINVVTNINIHQITQDILGERLANDRAFEIYIDTYYPECSDSIKTVYNLRKGVINKEENDFMHEFNSKSENLRLKLLCTKFHELSKESQEVVLALVDDDYKNIISELGENTLAELNYNFERAKKKYSFKIFNLADLASRVYEEFHEGDHFSDEYIKTKLGEIYRELDYPETRWPSSKEINRFFATEDIKVKENGKFVRGKILRDGLLYDWGDDSVIKDNDTFLNRLKRRFNPGDRIPCNVIKNWLGTIYHDFKYTRTPKATDISDWFIIKEVELSEQGQRIRGYEIIGFINAKKRFNDKFRLKEMDEISPPIEFSMYDVLKTDVYNEFRYRYKVSSEEIIKILTKIFKKYGYYRKPKVVDIDIWFDTKPCQSENREGRALLRVK